MAGSDKQIIYNNTGAADGSTNLIWDYTNNRQFIRAPAFATTDAPPTTTDCLIFGALNAATGTDRKAIRFNAGGFASPGAQGSDSNGDKIIVYQNAGGYDGRIGVGTTSNMWFKSSNTTTTGIFEFYCGTTPTKSVSISASGLLLPLMGVGVVPFTTTGGLLTSTGNFAYDSSVSNLAVDFCTGTGFSARTRNNGSFAQLSLVNDNPGQYLAAIQYGTSFSSGLLTASSCQIIHGGGTGTNFVFTQGTVAGSFIYTIGGQAAANEGWRMTGDPSANAGAVFKIRTGSTGTTA